MGIQSLNQKKGFLAGGQAQFAFDFANFCFKPGPVRHEGVEFQVGEQVLIVRQVGSVDGNGGNPRIEHRRDFDFGRLDISRILDAVMVRMDGHRNGDLHFIAKRVHFTRHIPEIGIAIGVGPAFGFGDFDNQY